MHVFFDVVDVVQENLFQEVGESVFGKMRPVGSASGNPGILEKACRVLDLLQSTVEGPRRVFEHLHRIFEHLRRILEGRLSISIR